MRPASVLLTGLTLSVVAAWTAPAAAGPNFLFLIADDLAWDDCGPFGHPTVRTPNLDRLAAQGLTFNNAFLTCASCSPSRASLMTGRYPHNHGAPGLGDPLADNQIIFPELLRAAGYYTAAVGKWHMGEASKRKLDLVREGVPTVPQMVPVLRDRPKNKPFCLWFGFYDPHRPYSAGAIPNPHTPGEVAVPPYIPDTPTIRADLALYYDAITRLDTNIGAVLAELDRQGVRRNTVVVFLSDNGRPFPRCKGVCFDSGNKTPLIVRWPALIRPGTQTDALVSAIDLAPTICHAAGIAAPAQMQGRTMAPLWRGEAGPIRSDAYSEHNWHGYEARERSVRTARYRYIRNFYPDLPLSPTPEVVRGPTGREMARLRDTDRLAPRYQEVFLVPRPREELYDLYRDPHEQNSLADDPQFSGILANMRARLTRWQSLTQDNPPGARRPDEYDRDTGEPL